MISSRAGRISRTAFRVAVALFILRRPFAVDSPAGMGRISPSIVDLNRSTAYRSSSSPRPKVWVRNVFDSLVVVRIARLLAVGGREGGERPLPDALPPPPDNPPRPLRGARRAVETGNGRLVVYGVFVQPDIGFLRRGAPGYWP